MSAISLILEGAPGPEAGTIRLGSGVVHQIPVGWVHLPPGDAALTRRVKAAGKYWLLSEKRGRKTFSRGMFAPGETIDRIRRDLESERSSPAFARKMQADKKRREQAQIDYQGEFAAAVLAFLKFHPSFQEMAEKLSKLVTLHATPVGSGTVARTKRIPVERRAEAAVIAWMRHQTTAYDQMSIPKIRGKRREVRRMLATRSRELLAGYRSGQTKAGVCPLKKALEKSES